jgi:serine/threonine protein kinase
MQNDPTVITKALLKEGYEFVSNLGDGEFTKVFKVFSPVYQQFFAAKVYYIGPQELTKSISSYLAELKTLSSVYHPNVTNVYSYFSDEAHLYIILEYCSDGSFESIIKEKRELTSKTILMWLSQTLRALSEYHKQGISHNNIKPSNILHDQYGRVKITDFGFSFINQKEQTSKVAFTAPEVLAGHQFQPFNSDLWSLGMTFYVLVFGNHPYSAKNDTELIKQIINTDIEIPETKDPMLKEILSLMLQTDPSQRPSCEELLSKFFINRQKEGSSSQNCFSLADPKPRHSSNKNPKAVPGKRPGFRKSLVVELSRASYAYRNSVPTSSRN